MTYFATSTVYIFFITTFSLFLSKQFRVKNELSLIYSILIISIITLCLFQLNLLRYGFFVIFICSVFIFIKIKINKFSDHTLRFVLYSSILVLFCYGKYFLDEDELTFWGINSKFIYYNFFSPTIIDAKTLFSIQYHSKLLTTFQSLGFIFSNFREDILILINNLIILATFFALFKSNKNNWGIQFFYFGIFYFLLNLFSFGLNSIYADIIVVLLTSLLFKKLYSNELDLFSLLLIIAIPLVHRIGNLFIFIFFLNLIIIN